MAKRDLGSGDMKNEELDDITTCCICTEVYTDPKALPCIHTFCMKCIQKTGLKTNKGPGDEMPCPICRRLFKIPPEGFHGLPKHFFIERLIEVSRGSDQSASSRSLCDACVEENKEDTGKEILAADTFCVDCNQKFCKECCRHHKKFKLTKNHKLIKINEHENSPNLTTYQAQSVCELHERKVVDVYCADCKTVVCAICFIDDHDNHKGSHVNKFVDCFRKQIKSSAEAINECRSKAEMKKAELLKVKGNVLEMAEKLECDVAKRIDEPIQLIDKHGSGLLQGLCSIRQSKLKEIQMATDDVDTYLSCLETYNSYCQKIMDKGSASDICRAVSDLSVRAMELQQQCQPMIDTEIQSFNFCLRKTELDAFLKESYDNLIGEVEDVEATLVDLKQNLEEEERTAWVEEKKQLMKQMQELQQESSGSRGRCLDLEQKLKLEQTEKDHLKEQTQKYRRIIDDLHDKYKSDPVLVHTIRTKSGIKNLLNVSFLMRRNFSAEVEEISLTGMTILDKELFVVSDESSKVEVYDSTKFSFSRQWHLKDLIHPLDMGSCNKNKCLYIFHCKDGNLSCEILRVDKNGKLISKWSTGGDWGFGLSVTGESSVILAVYEKNKLNEYSPDGQLIREINLSSDAGIHHPLHAIKMTSGDFIVSHGDDDDDNLHRVCIVETDGKLKKSFGGKCGSAIGEMNDPFYLSVDENGFVMVIDRENSRVLSLNSDLEFRREILSTEKHGLRDPERILLDESNGRLFVADNQSDYFGILIFDFE